MFPYIAHPVKLDHLTEVVFVRLLQGRVTLFLPLSILQSLGGNQYVKSAPEWGEMFHLLNGSIST